MRQRYTNLTLYQGTVYTFMCTLVLLSHTQKLMIDDPLPVLHCSLWAERPINMGILCQNVTYWKQIKHGFFFASHTLFVYPCHCSCMPAPYRASTSCGQWRSRGMLAVKKLNRADAIGGIWLSTRSCPLSHLMALTSVFFVTLLTMFLKALLGMSQESNFFLLTWNKKCHIKLVNVKKYTYIPIYW